MNPFEIVALVLGLGSLGALLSGWKRGPIHDLNISPNWLMLCGGVVWLVGELWGVHRNSGPHGNMDTTSEWVWWLEDHKWIGMPIRILCGIFVVSLFGHFWAHTPLLP